MKAVILAAGKGAKLSPFSETRPNLMLNIAGGSLFDHNLDLLRRSGINDIFVVVGHKKEKLIEQIGEHRNNGVNLHYVEQKRPLGIGDAVMQVRDKVLPGEYFLLIYGDIVTSANIFSKIQQSFHSFKSPVASICLPPSNEMFGNVFLNPNMRITRIVEKPKGNEMGNYVLAGVYIFPESIFGVLEKNGRSMEKAMEVMAKKEGLRASMWEDEWLDIVYPWDMLTANGILMDSWEEASISKTAILEANVTLQGPVKISDQVVIKAGAVLEGPCSIGKGCYIGNNSLIRSYTSLVQDHTHIGRLSFIGDSVLGEGVDIGAGSMTVNRMLDWKPVRVRHGKQIHDSGRAKLGAFIGDQTIIGAGNTIEPGTVVPHGKVFPARYSVPSRRK
ncbi:MAG: sugar phosphate nucleotidyltransferase [Nitrospinaceae bacterium]